jgi:alkyl sulfatase BDS1-like metallo-beta-lactamase superfamily hydrolase
MPYEPKDATPATVRVNRDAVALYDMDDQQDFADADRGFIAGFPDGKVLGPDGHLIFDQSRYDYIADEATAPDTVNPSQIQLDGDRSVLDAFARLIDEFDPNFNIVTP